MIFFKNPLVTVWGFFLGVQEEVWLLGVESGWFSVLIDRPLLCKGLFSVNALSQYASDLNHTQSHIDIR